MYDCIIIGMGPSGMSAGVYAKRSGLNVLMLEESTPGGLLNKISIVENYLGFKSVTGSELAFSMFEHLNANEVPYKIERVLDIKDNKEYKTVTTTKNTYNTKSIIISVGRKAKKSGIPNEDKFIHKGISYCALCDASLYKDKDIVVLGGGNSAFEEALYLSKIVKSINIIIRSDITADEELIDDVKNTSNITLKIGFTCDEIIGDDIVNSVRLNNNEFIKCNGVFIYYGYEAETSFLKNLSITDDKGYVIVDESMRTKIPFVYACGDIIRKDLYQIITGASEGAIAATSARKDIK